VNDRDVKDDAYTTIYLVDNILTKHKEKLPQDVINIKCKKMTLHRTLKDFFFCDNHTYHMQFKNVTCDMCDCKRIFF